MVRNGKLARSIHEQQWGRFVDPLSYKAESAGGELVRVDPKRTSMTCSSCGQVQAMPLCVREYRCEVCGLVEDRDVNAARNILSRGSAAAGWDIAPVETPVRPGIFVTDMSPGHRGRTRNRTQVHDCDFAI